MPNPPNLLQKLWQQAQAQRQPGLDQYQSILTTREPGPNVWDIPLTVPRGSAPARPTVNLPGTQRDLDLMALVNAASQLADPSLLAGLPTLALPTRATWQQVARAILDFTKRERELLDPAAALIEQVKPGQYSADMFHGTAKSLANLREKYTSTGASFRPMHAGTPKAAFERLMSMANTATNADKLRLLEGKAYIIPPVPEQIEAVARNINATVPVRDRLKLGTPTDPFEDYIANMITDDYRLSRALADQGVTGMFYKNEFEDPGHLSAVLVDPEAFTPTGVTLINNPRPVPQSLAHAAYGNLTAQETAEMAAEQSAWRNSDIGPFLEPGGSPNPEEIFTQFYDINAGGQVPFYQGKFSAKDYQTTVTELSKELGSEQGAKAWLQTYFGHNIPEPSQPTQLNLLHELDSAVQDYNAMVRRSRLPGSK